MKVHLKNILLCWRVLAVIFVGGLFSVTSTGQVPDQDYEFYASCEIAGIKFKKIMSAYGENVSLVPCDNLKYEKMRLLLEEVWLAYQMQFPKFRLFPTPHIVIYQRPDPDAAVSYDPETKKIPWFVNTTDSLLDNQISDEARMATLAHELGHAILKHPLNEAATKKSKFYFAKADHKPIGHLQNDDMEARHLATEWLSHAEIIGSTHLNEIDNLPFGPFGNLIFPFIFKARLSADLMDSENVNCKIASSEWNIFWGTLFGSRSLEDWSPRPSTTQLNLVADSTSKFKDSITKCDLPKRTLRRLLNEPNVTGALQTTGSWYGQEVLSRTNELLSSMESVVDTSPNYAVGILEATGKLRTNLKTIESTPKFSKLRFYSVEEEADDMAIEIMKSIGRPEGVKTWMMDIMKVYSAMLGQPNEAANCQKTLENNQVPAYGPLIDNHHSPCYRAYHNLQLVAE